MALSISTFVLGPIGNNTFLIADEDSKIAAVIDPSAASKELAEKIHEKNWMLEYILITHAHFDHIGGVKSLIGQFGNNLIVGLHSADLDLWREGGSSKEFGFDFSVGSEPNLILEDKQILQMGKIPIEVLHTPGHTPGHVTFSIKGALAAFCGDLIFYHGVGRTDLKISNEAHLLQSIKEKILTLDPETTLYPGHGPVTTVQEEIENNPFLLKKKRSDFTPLAIYLANSTARLSRITVTFICPGYCMVSSIFLAISLAIRADSRSSICSGLTIILTSRPA